MHKHIYSILFLLFASLALSAQVTVTGLVTEEDTGAPLIGVTVIEEGTSRGTVTDINGEYSITLDDVNTNLVFSYIGYVTQTQTVLSLKPLNVIMATDTESLDEVVVVGYGTQKKKVVTAAISKVKGKDLEKMPVMRIENSLQGRTSGVRVTTDSGQPGSAATVRIRGTSSINSSEPLYVVDGVIIGGGIDYLNQSDIESIEVLKDASAAIYGARAASGVILVTTKKGTKDRMEVNYNAYYGVQAPWKKLPVLNAVEYGTLMNEASVASGGDILFKDPQSLGEGTDWQDAIFNTQAPIQNHDISLAAGSEKSQYYISFGYFNQDGIVATSQSNYERFTTRFNSSHQVNKRLRFGNSLGYSRIVSRGVATNSEFGSPLGRAINLDPITPIFETDPEILESTEFTVNPVVTNENGDVYAISTQFVSGEIYNPLAAIETQQGFGWSDKLVGNVFGEIEIIEGLKFRSSVGIDLAFWGGKGFTPRSYFNSSAGDEINSYGRSHNRGLYHIFENTLSYGKTIGAHDFNVLVGTMADQTKGEGIDVSYSNVPFTSFDDAYFSGLGGATEVADIKGGGYEYLGRTSSLISRLQYNYDQKYLFTALLRRDGSYKFGSNFRYGYFPSASVGWVLTEESFLYKHPVINFLKVRGSWGISGNDQIEEFAFASTVSPGRNYTLGLEDNLTGGSSPDRLANPDLRWEETTQINFGFDAKIFKNMSVTFDIFNKITDDMLLGIDVPDYVGNNGPIGNIASMSNRGVELELGYDNKFGDLGFSMAGNVTYIVNEITDIGEEKDFILGQTFSTLGLQITRSEVGQPIGFFYGHQTDGIFQNEAEVAAYTNADGALIQPEAVPGDFKFIDINEDGVIDDFDRTKIGDPTPTWTYGFTTNVSWKGFDALIFSQGVAGNQVFKATRRFDLSRANMTGDALNRWTGEGSTNEYPRLTFQDNNMNFSRSSDFYLENGSFFRIKTLQLGYTLPNEMTNKIGVQKLRLYVSGNNIATFTQYTGFDPEIGGESFGVDRGIYPQARFFLVGVNASF